MDRRNFLKSFLIFSSTITQSLFALPALPAQQLEKINSHTLDIDKITKTLRGIYGDENHVVVSKQVKLKLHTSDNCDEITASNIRFTISTILSDFSSMAILLEKSESMLIAKYDLNSSINEISGSMKIHTKYSSNVIAAVRSRNTIYLDTQHFKKYVCCYPG